MKKGIFYSAAFVALSAISVSLAGHSEGKVMTPTQISNLEALSRYEGGGDVIPCHSSCKQNYNRAYVDCASCTRIEGWEGTGTEARCTR